MEKTKFFGENELNQKIPHQVLKHVYLFLKDTTAKPIFLFSGSVGFGIPTCVVSAEDCIIYYHKTLTTSKIITLLYTDIVNAVAEQNGKLYYVYIEMNDNQKIKIDMKAEKNEVDHFCAFVNTYRKQGTLYIKNRMQTDRVYKSRIDALRNGLALDKIILNEAYQKIDEEHKIAVQKIKQVGAIKEKNIDEKYQKIHEKNWEKMNQIAASRPHGSYTLQYCNGLWNDVPPCIAKITVNTLDLFMEIVPKGYSSVKIPFSAFHGANVTSNEVDLPEDNAKIKPTYYLHVQSTYNGQNTEIVFSNQQDKHASYDPIGQLQYAITHFPERIQERQARNARYDARAEQLAEEREQIIAKRNAQIERLHQDAHKITHGDEQPLTGIASFDGSPADEIRKYKALLDDGVITQEEFDTKKEELLKL